jgi:hypothetical protein
VSAAYRWINLLNSASNTEFAITTGAATGLKTQFLSSANGNGSFLGLGYNTAGGYPASGNVFGGVSFVANNASVGPNAAGMYAVAAEAKGSSALGTDLEFQVIAPTTSTAYRSFRLYGSGDVVVNATNAALATSANAGWFYMPSMAGEPTGSPTARTGAIPFVFDTTNGRLWLKNGSVISDVAAASVPTAGPVTGSTLTAGSIQRLGSSQAGNSYVLPNPATCTGSAIQVKCTNNGGIYQYFFTSSSGNIDGTASYTFVSQYQYASVTFVSDGANWQIEDGYGPGYLEDRPRFHGLVEWNGQPAYFNSSLALTSGSLNVYRIVAQTGGTISNICAYVSALGSGMTAATSTTVTATANNGSGAVRCTVTTSTGIGPTAVVAGVNADANGSWAVTVVDGTHVDLIGSTFVTTFSGSGTITTSANCAAIYSGSGAFLGSTADQVSAWGSTGGKTMALANTVAVQAGGVYYIAILFTGTASTFALWSASSGTVGMGNFNTTGSNLRWAVNGAGLTALPSSITPSSASATNAHGGWIALS